LSEIEIVSAEIAAELPMSDVVDGLIAPHDLGGLIVVGRGT
jgi:hypothetical protein